MNQKGIAAIFVLAGVLIIAVSAVSVVLIYNKNSRKSASQESSSPPRSSSGFTTETLQSPQSTPQTETNLGPKDTSNWFTYINPTLGYSLKVPPNWKEKTVTTADQIRFRDETEKVELQILTLAYDNPAYTGGLDVFRQILKGESDREYTLAGDSVKKIKNLTLDKCQAAQILFLSENSGYSTICAGSKRYISILLKSDTLNIDKVVEYKDVYDTILTTFKFNQFSLD